MNEDIIPPESELVEQYRQSYSRYGDSPAGVQWPRGRQPLRFDALTKHIAADGFSLLDYGCGLAHLKPYLDQRFLSYEYRGVDLVPDFVDAVATKFPGVWVRQVKTHLDVVDPVDHVVISGTFNIIEGGDRAAYFKKVQEALLHLFSLTRVSLSVNFMTDRVDFTQASALHVNTSEILEFVQEEMSSRFSIDLSYMPYEFTLVIYKDVEILRPDNVYRVAL